MRGRILLLLAVVPFVLLAVFHSAWLPSLANFLILAEPPSKADAAIVLAGDIFGKRVLKAAELARENWVPVVYVSGPVPFYEQNEADLAIAMAVRHGHPRVAFDPVYLKADSTREEAAEGCHYQAHHDRREKRGFVRHLAPFSPPSARIELRSVEPRNGSESCRSSRPNLQGAASREHRVQSGARTTRIIIRIAPARQAGVPP